MKRYFIAALSVLVIVTTAFAASWKTTDTEDSSINGGEIIMVENEAGAGNNWMSLSTIKTWVLSGLSATSVAITDSGEYYAGTTVETALQEAAAAEGSDTHVQFNDGGSFGGDSGLTYNKTTDSLTITGDIIVGGDYLTNKVDGLRTSVWPNNTSISPQGGGIVESYNEEGIPKIVIVNTEYPIGYTVASGTSALGTSAISSGACASAVTTTATGTATTDVINWGFNGDPTSTTGYSASANGMLTIIAYPSANNVNFRVCNNTAASVTPGAVTLNWKVQR